MNTEFIGRMANKLRWCEHKCDVGEAEKVSVHQRLDSSPGLPHCFEKVFMLCYESMHVMALEMEPRALHTTNKHLIIVPQL